MDAAATSTSATSRPAPAPAAPPKAKQRQQKNLSRYLHRATTFAVPSLPFSPSSSRDPTSRASFSGAAPLLFPSVSRQGSVAREPTSPVVSCIGQVKRKGKKKKQQQKEPKDKTAAGGGGGGSVLSRLFGRRKPPANAPPPAGEGHRRSTGVETLPDPDPFKAGRVVILQPITWPSKKPVVSTPVPADSEGTDAASADSTADSTDSVAESAGTDAVPQPIISTEPADSATDCAESTGLGEEAKEKKEMNLWKRRAIRPLRPLVVGVGPPPPDGLRTV